MSEQCRHRYFDGACLNCGQETPEINPDDLIALRDHREYLNGYLKEIITDLMEGASPVLMDKTLQVGRKRMLHQLDTLITRLSNNK